MQKFQVGIAHRGTAAPEVKEVVEANSFQEAMLSVVNRYGGSELVLVTYAHYFPHLQSPPTIAD